MRHLRAIHRGHLTLADPAAAWNELQQAEARCNEDTWFRWVYYPRMQAEMARYWIARGDLRRAAACARVSLEDGERTLSRKRMAWAHKLLGEIAMLEDRPEDAQRELAAALQVLHQHPCPTIEWQILQMSAAATGAIAGSGAGDDLLTRARAVVCTLADSVRDEARRRQFRDSESIRAVLR